MVCFLFSFSKYNLAIDFLHSTSYYFLLYKLQLQTLVLWWRTTVILRLHFSSQKFRRESTLIPCTFFQVMTTNLMHTSYDEVSILIFILPFTIVTYYPQCPPRFKFPALKYKNPPYPLPPKLDPQTSKFPNLAIQTPPLTKIFLSLKNLSTLVERVMLQINDTLKSSYIFNILVPNHSTKVFSNLCTVNNITLKYWDSLPNKWQDNNWKNVIRQQ